VNFADGGVGGSFSANPVTTGSAGTATESYTLPTVARSITVKATYSTLSVNIGEKSLAGSPATQSILSGNNQTAHPSSLLSKPLVVKVVDQYGNAVSGVRVAFDDGGAGGTLAAPNP